jgi:amino acid permease
MDGWTKRRRYRKVALYPRRKLEYKVEMNSGKDLHNLVLRCSCSNRRSLTERHVNMIAFSSTIGIGLFLQSGKILYLIGPGGAVLAYLIMGSLLWSANASLEEMTAVFPVKGPIIDFPGRYLDEGIGFTVGWMAW